jgi:hypothetical protein
LGLHFYDTCSEVLAILKLHCQRQETIFQCAGPSGVCKCTLCCVDVAGIYLFLENV